MAVLRALVAIFAFVFLTGCDKPAAPAAPAEVAPQLRKSAEVADATATTDTKRAEENVELSLDLAASETGTDGTEVKVVHDNPYMHTTPTAEALAAIFMLLAFVICYIECCLPAK